MHIQNLVQFYYSVLKILSGNEIQNETLTSIKGHNSITSAQKIKKKKLDIVNINVYTKFGEILSISSKDNGRK